MRLRGSTASTPVMHLADHAWVSLLFQMYLWVLLNGLMCSVFALLYIVQNMPIVSCVIDVAVLMCARAVPQAPLFVWRDVVAAESCVVILGIQMMPIVLRMLFPYGVHVAIYP